MFGDLSLYLALSETNFNGYKTIYHVAVKRIGYYEIDLDLIERARSQARQEKTNVGIEETGSEHKGSGTDGTHTSCEN